MEAQEEEEFYPSGRLSQHLQQGVHGTLGSQPFTQHLPRGKEEEEQGDSSWGRSPTYGLQCNMA